MILSNKDNKPVILAIETSSRIGSVALGFGDKIAGIASFSGFMRHSAEIFPAIEELLAGSGINPNQIEHIYISNGPGSFTGLRIAAAIAKMVYLANPVKIVTVSSLDVTACNAADAVKAAQKEEKFLLEIGKIQKVASVLDAKRGQFFIAVYNVIIEGTEVKLDKVVPDYIISAAEFTAQFACEQNPIWLLGDGLLFHKQEFQTDGVNFFEEKYWSPRAEKVYILGRELAGKNQFAEPVGFKPFYLYRPEIITKQR
ncbi:MAG: tRNA (adenosine(37)-N6)-threonylcarbamoyltransferase complex dimerization subunit type 1 TsaB [Sedimentisphaerales bacterium]|nr:tRNA (adenosine(37)-N6)-threonylcarbamoyltransferase complex dimerization subunit type 1 TsaB [Sedimentisphaerales bacterium]